MCGRFLLDSEIREIIEKFKIEDSMIKEFSQGDFYPSSCPPVIIQKERRMILPGKWGFKTKERNDLIINARAETAFEKPLFKSAIQNRRCIIPASLYYEWKQEVTGEKVKYGIEIQDKRLLALGGIYNIEMDENEEKTLSFVIITTDAGRYVSEIHHRMPVIITEENIDLWIGKGCLPEKMNLIFERTREVPLNLNKIGRNITHEQISMF